MELSANTDQGRLITVVFSAEENIYIPAVADVVISVCACSGCVQTWIVVASWRSSRTAGRPARRAAVAEVAAGAGADGGGPPR